ncbi:MAG: acyl carrier protein [Chloroflexi bacterium B3_Chlor]|nr:MAG: acyl carrier protein [Chloroflexi bacterium B3_Chlor]
MSEAREGDVFSVIKAIIVEQLGADEAKVLPEANFKEDLEADSLDLVELIMAFEEYFEEKFGRTVEISDEEAQEITTVGQAVSYIEKRIAEEGLA